MSSDGFWKAFEKMKDSFFPLPGNQPLQGMWMKKREVFIPGLQSDSIRIRTKEEFIL